MAQYTIRDLGELGGNESIGFDVSYTGACAAVARLPSVAMRACRYTSTGMLVALPTLGGFNSIARGINIAETIVGYAELATGGYHATVWEPGVPPMSFNPLGGNFSEAIRISDAGHVVGFAGTAAPTARHAFMRDPGGVVHDLGTLPGGQHSSGEDVNILGHVAGTSDAPGFTSHAFYWTSANGMTSIAKPGWRWSRGMAINRTNTIVGEYTELPSTRRAYFWKPGVGAVDLSAQHGVLPNDINDLDAVVGEMPSPYGGLLHAFHWSAGVLTDLNDVIPLGSNWKLVSARGINNLGQIVGDGVHLGGRRGFLLTPVPVPPPPPQEDPGFDPSKLDKIRGIALVIWILSGVIDDSGGWVVIPGKGPAPVGPWGPMLWQTLSARERHEHLANAIKLLAGQFGEARARDLVLHAVESLEPPTAPIKIGKAAKRASGKRGRPRRR